MEEPTEDGFDNLFAMLRNGKETELVVLLDNSVEVRPNHFYLVDKTSLDNLFKYHVSEEDVSVSLLVFGEDNVTVACKEVENECDDLKYCINQTSYNSMRSDGWIGNGMGQAIKDAQEIFDQPSKANKQKILLIVSSFHLTEFRLNRTVITARDAAVAAGEYDDMS